MTAKSCILLRTPLKLLFNLCTTSQTFRTARTSLSVAYSTLPLKMRPARKKPVVDEPPSESSLSAVAYSTAGEYDLIAVSKALQKQGLYQQKSLSPDVEEVVCATAKYELNEEHRDLFIFKEGSVVFWNFPELERKSVLHLLKAYEVDSYSPALVEEETESLEYTFHNNKPKFVNGKIFLPSEGSLDLEKYTFSNGMALSVKLAIWEASLDAYVESIECLIEDMKDGRKIRMTRDQLFRKTGELFSLRHLINLSSDLLDTPDFYWDRENLEILYLKVVKYMNIERRTKVMNEKLTHCCELMELLSHHLEDKHHVRLEIMIIVLIMVEEKRFFRVEAAAATQRKYMDIITKDVLASGYSGEFQYTIGCVTVKTPYLTEPMTAYVTQSLVCGLGAEDVF